MYWPKVAENTKCTGIVRVNLAGTDETPFWYAQADRMGTPQLGNRRNPPKIAGCRAAPKVWDVGNHMFPVDRAKGPGGKPFAARRLYEKPYRNEALCGNSNNEVSAHARRLRGVIAGVDEWHLFEDRERRAVGKQWRIKASAKSE
jgi:hypothetical protein